MNESIEVLLITHTIFWLLVFALTDNYNKVSIYAVLGKLVSGKQMLMLLTVVSYSMIIAGITKCKWLRCASPEISIYLEELNVRSATIILAAFSAYQFIIVIRGRRLLL